jgi:outer membrane protein
LTLSKKARKILKMKKLLLLLTAVLLINVSAFSQAKTEPAPLKIGVTSIEFILSELPEAKKIEDNLKEYEAQLMRQLQNKVEEFQRKVKVYQQEGPRLSELIRADKEEELINLQNSIQKFEKDAQSSIQQRQGELLTPIYDKIEKAVEQVAKENGFTYVFNYEQNGMQFMLFADESTEISDLILKKLGVTNPVSVK